MTKKRSLIVAVVAFAALMLPMLRLENFIDTLLCLLFAKTGCVNVPLSLHLRVVAAAYDAFGVIGGQLVSGWLLPCVITLVPTVFIYRYVRRRDFDGICADCAAHPIRAWFLLALFVIFTIATPRISTEGVMLPENSIANAEVGMEEMSGDLEPVRLELCLCHPDTEKLTKSMASDGGTITTQAIAAAKSVDGYRLMACERNGEIFEVVYVSERAEITEADVKLASVERDPMSERYSVGGVLKSEAASRFKELTGAYKPWGKKNNREMGYRLAIIVNGRLVTAPVIQMEIGAAFQITGNFTREEAMKLAASLNRAGNEGGF